jgi:VWFA-related protein
MKMSLRRASAAAVALVFVLSSLPGVGFAAQSARAPRQPYDRLLTEHFDAVAIENASGRTEVQTWNSGGVRVVASRPAGADGSGALDARIQLAATTRPTRALRGGVIGALGLPPALAQAAPASLKITVLPAPQDGRIDLSVYVPAHISLSVRGGADDVVIKGVSGAMSVETDAGGIALHLPAGAGADLSLRAVAGAINAKLPLVAFGPADAHTLDGRTGEGGAPIILRSARGSIDLLADDPARLGQETADALKSAAGTTRRIQLVGQVNLGGGADEPRRCAQTRPDAAGDTGDDGPGARGPAEASARGADASVATADDVARVNVRLVNLNAKVTDPAGKFIPDLVRDDFQVFEDGVEQEVVHFEPVTAPVNLVLLLDLSGSTKDRMKVMKKAAKKFIDSLSPNTRIAAAAFTRRFMLISDFTDDRKLLKDRIEHVKNLQSGTAFYDAMWATLDLFNALKEKRKAVVVLTDGVDNSLSSDDYEPCYSFDTLLARMTREDVTIYPIYFDTEYETIVRKRGDDTHEAYVKARRQLQQVADDTGGTLFKAERAEDLEGVYERVADELHTLYSVAYNPKEKNYDGKWRNISVKIKGRTGTARTKRGYYAL